MSGQADPDPIIITLFSGGVRKPQGVREKLSDLEALAAFIEDVGREELHSGARFAGDYRSNGNWRGTRVAWVDIDRKDKWKWLDKKEKTKNALDEVEWKALVDAAYQVEASLYYRTPHGFRMGFLLSKEVTDKEQAKRVLKGASAIVREKMAAFPELKKVEVDEASKDLAQAWRGPRLGPSDAEEVCAQEKIRAAEEVCAQEKIRAASQVCVQEKIWGPEELADRGAEADRRSRARSRKPIAGSVAKRAKLAAQSPSGGAPSGAPIPKPQAYAKAILSKEVEELESMAPGSGRNARLNKAAFKLAPVVELGWIPREEVEEELARAVSHQGPSHNVDATIESGLRGGPDLSKRVAELRRREEEGAATSGANRGGGKDKLHRPDGTTGGSNLAQTERIVELYDDPRYLPAVWDAARAVTSDPVYESPSRELVTIESSEEGTHMKPMRVAALVGWFQRAGVSFVRPGRGGDPVLCSLSVDQRTAMLADTPSVRGIPRLRGFLDAPGIASEDGRIVEADGYDEESKLFLRSSLRRWEPLPEAPTQAEAIEARKVLQALFAEFHFADEASPANLLGLLVMLLTRSMHSGSTPAGLVEADVQRAGKTILTKALQIIATGSADVAPLPPRDEELGKQILSDLRDNPMRVFCFDNAKRLVGGESIEALLTSTCYSGRVLGATRALKIKHRAAVLITGNNCQVSPDMAERVVPVQLLRRDGYQPSFNLEKEVTRNRAVYLRAALIMIRAWVVAGRPAPANPVRLVGFECAVEIADGVLAFAGVEGFLAGRNEAAKRMTEPELPSAIELEINKLERDGTAVSAQILVEEVEERTTKFDPRQRSRLVSYEIPAALAARGWARPTKKTSGRHPYQNGEVRCRWWTPPVRADTATETNGYSPRIDFSPHSEHDDEGRVEGIQLH